MAPLIVVSGKSQDTLLCHVYFHAVRIDCWSQLGDFSLHEAAAHLGD